MMTGWLILFTWILSLAVICLEIGLYHQEEKLSELERDVKDIFGLIMQMDMRLRGE